MRNPNMRTKQTRERLATSKPTSLRCSLTQGCIQTSHKRGMDTTKQTRRPQRLIDTNPQTETRHGKHGKDVRNEI